VVTGQNSFPGGETLGYNLLIASLFPVHKIKMCNLAVGCLVGQFQSLICEHSLLVNML